MTILSARDCQTFYETKKSTCGIISMVRGGKGNYLAPTCSCSIILRFDVAAMKDQLAEKLSCSQTGCFLRSSENIVGRDPSMSFSPFHAGQCMYGFGDGRSGSRTTHTDITFPQAWTEKHLGSCRGVEAFQEWLGTTSLGLSAHANGYRNGSAHGLSLGMCKTQHHYLVSFDA
jgi:hypothetical protein